MSFSARRWALDYGTRKERPVMHRPLQSGPKHLLLVLAELENNRRGYAWPSFAELSELTGMSRRSVINHVSVLDELDLITVNKRKRADGLNEVNQYRLNVPAEYREQDRTWDAALMAGQEWDEQKGTPF